MPECAMDLFVVAASGEISGAPVFSWTLYLPCTGDVKAASWLGIVISNNIFFNDDRCSFLCSYFFSFFVLLSIINMFFHTVRVSPFLCFVSSLLLQKNVSDHVCDFPLSICTLSLLKFCKCCEEIKFFTTCLWIVYVTSKNYCKIFSWLFLKVNKLL